MSFLRKLTECKGISLSIPLHAVIGPLIFCDTGSDGYFVNWRCYGTVFLQVFGRLLTSYLNR
jgi:hypothetical protein